MSCLAACQHAGVDSVGLGWVLRPCVSNKSQMRLMLPCYRSRIPLPPVRPCSSVLLPPWHFLPWHGAAQSTAQSVSSPCWALCPGFLPLWTSSDRDCGLSVTESQHLAWGLANYKPLRKYLDDAKWTLPRGHKIGRCVITVITANTFGHSLCADYCQCLTYIKSYYPHKNPILQTSPFYTRTVRHRQVH